MCKLILKETKRGKGDDKGIKSVDPKDVIEGMTRVGTKREETRSVSLYVFLFRVVE